MVNGDLPVVSVGNYAKTNATLAEIKRGYVGAENGSEQGSVRERAETNRPWNCAKTWASPKVIEMDLWSRSRGRTPGHSQ